MIHITIRRKHIALFIAVFTFMSAYGFVANALAGLSCTVASTCPTGTVIWRMSSTTNAHSEVASNSNYSQLVCCTGLTGIGNACSGTYAVVGRISSSTNAHFEQNIFSDYPKNICLQAPAGGTVTVAYQASNCTGYDTTLGSSYSNFNTHMGDGNAYSNKICASMTQPGLTFVIDSSSESLNVTPGVLAATTSILYAQTTNPSGFVVSVQKLSTNTLQLLSNPTIVIPDKSEFIAPSATTTTAATTASSTQLNSLQFRLRAADTDYSNYASSWWGTDDTSSGALFAGFPTTTQQIVNRSTPAAATTTSTVLYNLNVAVNQVNGTYSGTVTYTATVNP